MVHQITLDKAVDGIAWSLNFAVQFVTHGGGRNIAFVLAVMAESEIGRDMKEPGARPFIITDLGEMLPGAKEGLLPEIIRRLLVVGHPPEIVEDLALIAVHKFLKCLHIRAQSACRPPFLERIDWSFGIGQKMHAFQPATCCYQPEDVANRPPL